MVLALVANLYPVPEGPYGKPPYIYLAYLAAVLSRFAAHSHMKNFRRRRNIAPISQFSRVGSFLFCTLPRE